MLIQSSLCGLLSPPSIWAPKSRRFDLESTHLTNPDRMDKLMNLLALAFIFCLTTGH